jgi:excisionase family DNA binding protein
MSSKIQIQRVCECCGKEFTAQTTVTRFCSHKCNSRAYKLKIKELKIGKSNEETNQQKILSASDVQLEVIKQKDFLSIKEAYTLLGVSERTFYRLLKIGIIPATKLGGRTIIKRSIIDNLFAL